MNGDELVQELEEAPPRGEEAAGGPDSGVPFPAHPRIPASFRVASQATMNKSAFKLKKVNYTHEALADAIIQNPWASQGELAAHFGYTESWLSRIIASDAFQAYLAARKDEVIDPRIRATVEERFKGLVIQSIEKLHQRLEVSPSDDLLLGVMNGAAKALGYGARQTPQVTVQNFVAVVPQKDASSQAWAERVAQPTPSDPAYLDGAPSSTAFAEKAGVPGGPL